MVCLCCHLRTGLICLEQHASAHLSYWELRNECHKRECFTCESVIIHTLFFILNAELNVRRNSHATNILKDVGALLVGLLFKFSPLFCLAPSLLVQQYDWLQDNEESILSKLSQAPANVLIRLVETRYVVQLDSQKSESWKPNYFQCSVA